MGAYRPPSRHKDPPMNLGLDLPNEDMPYLDEDSEDSFGFEIGIDKANQQKQKMKVKRFTQDDSEESFERKSSEGRVGGIGGFMNNYNNNQQVDDFHANDHLMNSSGKRKISTANTTGKSGSANKRNIIATNNNKNQFMP